MRILLVSQYFPPEIGATQTRMKAFAEHLAERGHQVTVICEFPNHPSGIIPPEYRGRLIEDDRSNPYRVLRVWVKANEDKTPTTRTAFYASFMVMAIAVAPLTGPADVVFASSPPLLTGVAGATLAQIKRCPFVFDVRDLWPAAAVSLDQMGPGLSLQVAEFLERYLYRHASAVTAVTRPFCTHIDGLRPRGPRTIYLPNGTVESFFDDVAPLPREALGASDDSFLVTFAGTHGIAQALPNVLSAAQLSNSNVRFALVGDGAIKEALVAEARERDLDNLSFVAPLPPEEIGSALAASDALLVPLSGHELFRTFIPSKLFDYMAAGKPVVVSAAGEAERIVREAGAGIAVAPEDPAELAAAVQWLASHPADSKEMGARGRAYARGWLRSRQAARLESILESVAR